MARWEDLPKYERDYLAGMRLPEFDDTPWTPATPLPESRVALMTTAGIERRDDKPYPWFSGEFRLIPTDVDPSELVMSHLSPNFDRTGFQQDINVVFPIARMRELQAEGFVGSVAKFHCLLPRQVTGSVGDGSDGRRNAEYGDNPSIMAVG